MKNWKCFFGMKIVLVFVVFTSSSCNAISSEEVATVNTIVVSRVSPTQAPDLIPQTSSTTPTLTVRPTHTSTIPVPTAVIQPTAMETQKPIPTVADMEVTQQVLWLFETNNGCLLPCWWGITPGQTTWQTAQEFLSVFDSNIPGVSSASGSTYYGALIPLPTEVFLAEQLALGISVNDDIVERISTDVKSGHTPPGYLTQYTLPMFLTTYGPPSEVRLFTYSSPRGDDLPFVTILYYAEQGIAALYGINGERQGEFVLGCIQDEPVSYLNLWSPNLNLTFEEVTNGTSALEWDYLSLGESTEMGVTTFYETFKNPENTTCLETPAELWR